MMADKKKYGFAGAVPKSFNISELSAVLDEIIPQE
jgi:hypothetical protein